MQDHAETNLAWGHAILSGIQAFGVERVYASPGSRSTPLTLAAARHPGIQLRMVLDERAAAFMALGAARGSGKPVALIATSGTAIAEWMPAVVEADLSRVPLILLSADRPPELRQCGANQTMEQSGMFGSRVRFSHELPLPETHLMSTVCHYAAQAVAMATWPLPGPVHLNVPLREPLVPLASVVSMYTGCGISSALPRLQPDTRQLQQIADAISGQPGLILCGSAWDHALPAVQIADLARRLRAPVLADPPSGIRDGTHDHSQIIALYDLCLRQESFRQALAPQWVLRFGALPISKQLEQFLTGLGDVRHIVVEGGGRWTDPIHAATNWLVADAAEVAQGLLTRVQPASSTQLELWLQRQQVVAAQLADTGPSEALAVKEIIAALPAGSLLFSGNSLPIRQLDWFHAGCDKPLTIVCNRGASGIDGNLATLLGLAQSRSSVIGLLGDLTFLHDIGALGESSGVNAVLLILDNGGGGIFDHLPQAGLPEHEELFVTPRSVDIAMMAKAYAVGYRQVALEQVGQAIRQAQAMTGLQLLHLHIDREQSLLEHRRLWAELQQ